MADYEQVMIRYPKGSKVPDRLKKEAAARTKPGGQRMSLNEYILLLLDTHPDRTKARK